MANDFESSSNKPPENSSCSGSGSNDAANFECNICFELAQDPIVTLCGHLFCWPCLYKWLHIHGRSQECPVCKAVIQEEKLVPLYGRGKTPTDPRSKSIPGMEIPHRPAGQRPETARPPDQNQFPHHGFGFMGGLAPMATTRFGNFTFSTGFGGLFPSLLNFHLHGYPDATTIYGSPAGMPYGFANPFYGGHGHGFPHPPVHRQQRDILKVVFLALGIFVILALLWPWSNVETIETCLMLSIEKCYSYDVFVCRWTALDLLFQIWSCYC